MKATVLAKKLLDMAETIDPDIEVMMLNAVSYDKVRGLSVFNKDNVDKKYKYLYDNLEDGKKYIKIS